jgi:flavin reductase (DIM6/NTAB) family NADH-FMN oxidoreductase RutF
MPLTDPQRQLGAALGRIPSGLFIITVRHGPHETGLLASWIQQCSFEPPLVTFAIKHGRFIADWLPVGAGLTVNILDDTQTDLIGHFGRGFEPDEPAFRGLEIRRRDREPPILEECLGYLDCRVVSRHPAGDHELFIAEVAAGGLLNEGRPMVHVRKSGMHY